MLRTPKSDKEIRDFELIQQVFEIHNRKPELGYRGVYDHMLSKGIDVTEYKVRAICHYYQIKSNIHKRPNNYSKSETICSDLVRRNFTDVNKPNTVWFTDITEHKTDEGKLYVCVIKDAFSRAIIGKAMGSNMKAWLVCAALEDALMKRGYPQAVIIHSDRGSQFRSKKWLKLLAKYGLLGSMGNAHTCADNAAMESFFGRLQDCVLDQRKVWKTRQELRQEITKWINLDYNRILRNRTTKMTPEQMDLDYENNPEKYNNTKQKNFNLVSHLKYVILSIVKVS